MDPQTTPTNEAPGLSLPPVQPAAAQPAQPQPTAAPATDDQAATPVTAAPATAQAQAPQQPAQASVDDATPLIADDADLIEKEWVEKAKQLVDKTKADPYNQNKEINKFKATYIKKRYNKDVQLSKD